MKTLLLTEHEEQTLRMFLLMTTNYRRGEQNSCASLATEANEDGTPTYPKMEANAQWWQGCIDTIDAITEKIGIRGGGLPLEVAEAALYARYKNMHDDEAAGMSKKMIERERTFYDGMLQMLELLGGQCEVSEYGFHNISFVEEPVQQKPTTDPADSQQSQAGTLTYGATNADTIQAIDCMTQHIMVFRAQSTHSKTADFAEPCQTCRHAKSCSFDWVSVMHPLLTQSSVQVSMVDSEH